jgi:hypothetical protein
MHPAADVDERSVRFLRNALLFTFVIHAVAMLSMVLFLIPGLPGGGVDDAAMRAAYVAAHPWLWRIGWLPWQITALSDLILGVALVRTRIIPRIPAILTLLVTIVAVIPDQLGQVRWITEGVSVAERGITSGNPQEYFRLESELFFLTSAWGATLYVVGALGWTWCFVSAGLWSRLLGWLSAVTWGIFFVVSAGLFLPAAYRPAPGIVSAGNAIAFLLMQLWFILVIERLLRRVEIEEPHGRYARWRHPAAGIAGRIVTAVGESRFPRALLRYLPTLSMASDIVDVVYINYLVPASRLEPLVPPGLDLQRLGPDGAYALFTALTYRHGGFGPRLLGPLRRMLPSPLQSNWRIHVVDPSSGLRGVYFVTTAIDNTLYALGARTLSDGMPMHLVKGRVAWREDGGIDLLLDPGAGSGPDLDARLHPISEPELSPPWSLCFTGWRDFLAYTVPQDRMLTSHGWQDYYSRLEIRLDIPLEICEPLGGEVRSRAAHAIAGNAEPLCFRVPRVAFRFDKEERVVFGEKGG